MSQDLLFHKYDIRKVCAGQEAELRKEVESYDATYLLNVKDKEVHAYLLDKYRIAPVTLYPDQATSPGAKDVDIDVSQDFLRMIHDRSQPFYLKGTMITVHIPFTGEKDLFHCHPSTYNFNPPTGIVMQDHLEPSFQQLDTDGAKLTTEYERTLKSINEYLGWIQSDIQSYNASLPSLIQQIVAARKTKVSKDRDLEAAFGIPLTRIATAAPIPAVKRKPPIRKPKAAPTPPEPTVSDEEYNHILTIIENMVLVMERSPHAFAKMDEESLRDHILVQLNGHYEGQATGETFNFTGKTDILIRSDGGNVFIAECKFWTGSKGFLDAIDQLLGYTTYRDTKTALIIFNKNKDHSGVLGKITDSLTGHHNFKRGLGRSSESRFRSVFQHPRDDQRNIYLAVLTFHLPAI